MKIPTLPLATLTVSGKDHFGFLQGLLTQDLMQLPTQSYACNHQGKVIAMMWVIQEASCIHLITHSSSLTRLHQHLDQYVLVEDVVITPDHRPVFGTPKHKCGWPSGFDLSWTPPASPLSAQQWHHILMHQGDVCITDAIHTQYLPSLLTLNPSAWLSLSKGCYLGQEIIARLHHKGKLKKSLKRLSGRYAADSMIDYMGSKHHVVDASHSEAWVIG